MPPQAPATLPADFFSKLPPDTLPANFDFNGSAPASSKPEGAVSRFLTRATGLPVSDIAEHPGKYINPFSDEYRQAARDNRNQPVGPSSVREMIPFGQTAKDLSDKNYAGALGDIAPGALAALSMARMGRSPLAERVPLWKRAGIEAGRPAPNIEVTEVPEPQLRQQSRAQSAQTEPSPVQPAKTEYPEGLQKRPTDRTEIVSDKAIQDAMRNNLEQHGWQALSQERKEFFANNGPQLGKADLIAQARAEAIRAEAEQRAQQVLAEAANPTVKLTRMPKGAIPPDDAWFGKSQVVDQNGAPLTVYHGTAKAFDEFSKEAGGANTGFASSKNAIWFTDSPDVADFYAYQAGQRPGQLPLGNNIRPANLKLENPLVLDAAKRNWDISTATARAARDGRDGIIIRNVGGDGTPHGASTFYGVFDSTRIRPAFGTTRTPVPAAAKAQPVAEDLNSPNRLVDLMQQSIDLINSRKGK